MKPNYLEQLAAERYDFQGYFVRRNVNVGLRAKGGYDCELDVVAFNPSTKHPIQVEPTMDADSWAERERRYRKKFRAGRKYIPGLFRGLELPNNIEQVALMGFASKEHHKKLARGKIVLISELLEDIINKIKDLPIPSKAIGEDKPILRTLQFVCQHREVVHRRLFPSTEKPSLSLDPRKGQMKKNVKLPKKLRKSPIQ